MIQLHNMRKADWMVFDLETDLLEFDTPWWFDKSKEVIQVAWKRRGGPIQHHYGSLANAGAFWEDLEAAEVLVAHRVQFEAHWLARSGYDPTDKAWADTMILEKFIHGSIWPRLNLGDTAERYGLTAKDPMIDQMMKAGVPTRDQPQERLMARCRRDVRTTEQILYKQCKRLLREKRIAPALMRCQLTPILVMMEREGMTLDPARVEAAYAQYVQEHNQVKYEFDALTGGINQKSSDQVAEMLYKTLKFPELRGKNGKPIRNKKSKRWPEGKPKADKVTVEQLLPRARTKKQREFVALRSKLSKLDAALDKNLKFFVGVCREYGGKFVAPFNQANVKTDRLSSSGLKIFFEMFQATKSVQFQNMPNAFKNLFRSPDEDYYLVEADAAQLEFRGAGQLGQDPQILEDVVDPDFDAHCKSASEMNQIPYDEFLTQYRARVPEYYKMRRDAKPDTFKPLYGGTQGTEEQQRWYEAFNRRYHVLVEKQEEWLDEVMHNGTILTEWGQRYTYRFKYNDKGTAIDTSSGKPIKQAVFNHRIQAFCTAEIVPIAIIHLYHRCKAEGLRVKFLNTVHDSVIALVHKEDMDAYREACVWAFTTAVYEFIEKYYGIKINVTLGCEVVHGSHWSEGEEYSVDVPPEV
jgi:DNA polymerase I-like protein with 3'-5' exonuclease and polymerase domains